MTPGDWLKQPALFLLALPVIALLVLAWGRSKNVQASVPIPDLAWMMPGAHRGKARAGVCIAIRALALLALIPLVADPGRRPLTAKRAATPALVVVLDNSSSMTAADFQAVNRLGAAKRSLRVFLNRLPEAEIGLVTLAGSPRTLVPVTEDRRFVLAALGRIEPTPYEEDGTAIGSGVATAVNRLRSTSNGPRRLLLITDGVSNRGNVSPADAAEVARVMDVRIDAIGIGTDSISRFSVPTSEGMQQSVEARIDIDDRALEGLATRTGGTYSRVRSLQDLENALARLEATYRTSGRSADKSGTLDWTFLLALISSALLAAETGFRHFVVREIPQ